MIRSVWRQDDTVSHEERDSTKALDRSGSDADAGCCRQCPADEGGEAGPGTGAQVQIGKAKRVFVSNAGADVVGTVFSGGDDRPYNQFYAEMKNWGRYQLMPSPAGSDLIFEVVFVNQVVGFDVNNGTEAAWP